MRVLVIPLPYPTHLMAMVPLCWALRTSGHEVLIACPPEVRATAHAAGLTTVDVPGHEEAPATTIRLRFPLPAFGERYTDAGRDLWRATADSVVRDSLDRLADYRAVAESWRPSLLLVDVCALVGRVLGGLLDVPVAAHRWGVDPTAGPFTERARELLDLPEPTLVLDPCPPGLQAVDAPPGRPVQFVPYNGSGTVPGWSTPPPGVRRICVCMGRMVLDTTGPAPLRRAVAAATAVPGTQTVVAVSREHRRWLADLPADVLVAESVPLNLFLDTCAAVVCAGGSGTALTATRFGVPQLVLPQYFDQFDYARNLAAAGAGLALPDGDSQSDHDLLTGSLAALLDDSGFASAAAKLGDEIAEMPRPTEVVRALEHV
ncbi:DUF1205 domain-containing protein [Saccharothrix violaceirubra]|uniref:UDP:flavonoid glycosyltransferase YjiC (YdhE family) n=1 Tax=Saccharothrix violaceirubra TaxID=413306 RepID=A0A7W7WW17_9PSEU|nr:nucleotide disphospho-sugar-binding domain-containing protein [Saccharothrix violaceirubra]MBB4965641.1 UDP:flavonoid glycosyltransferase YjiC (YdhE family) [Saccharothrix violaceirubra]